MESIFGIVLLAALFVGSFVLFWLGHQRLLHRYLITDLPFSKTNGVFVGLVSVKGTAETTKPVETPFTKTQCVSFSWYVSEDWERWETETYQDKDGHTHTRQVLRHGSDTIASGGHNPPYFYLLDETGWVRVFPEKSEAENRTILSESVTEYQNPALYSSVRAKPVFGSTGVRNFYENGILLHDTLYVIGNALYNDAEVLVEIRDDANGNTPFVISYSEPSKTVQNRGCEYGCMTFGAVAIWFGFLYATAQAAENPFILLWSALGIALLCFLCWLYVRYYSIINLKNKARQAFSNVDIQLQRRSNLIPRLTECVRAVSRQEKEVLRVLAALRAEAMSNSTYNIRGCIPGVNQLVERLPDLKSDANFVAFWKELHNTEQKIALARTYYNDVVTRWNIRIEHFPESLIARAARLHRMEWIQTTDLNRVCPEMPFAK